MQALRGQTPPDVEQNVSREGLAPDVLHPAEANARLEANTLAERLHSNSQASSHQAKAVVAEHQQLAAVNSPCVPLKRTAQLGWDRRFRPANNTNQLPNDQKPDSTPTRADTSLAAETSFLQRDARSVAEVK